MNQENDHDHISTFKGIIFGVLTGAAFWLAVVFVFSF
jgi:hypothetical protein